MTSPRYHTVIIGAGMSGLAAGIRLAYFEKPVCILERHTTIGGLNSFYRLRGRNYDVGLHAVTNFALPAAKSKPLNRILRQLRLRWDDFDLHPQRESAIVFPGQTLRFNNDAAYLTSQVAAQFPEQVDGFRRLVAWVEGFPDAKLTESTGSARERLREFLSDPLLTDMLLCPLMYYGSARPNDMDLGQFVIMFRSIFLEGLARPLQGVRRILKTLVRHYMSLGGELKLRHGVRSIRVEDRRAVGVVLDDGREIAAEHVLSSAGGAETFRLCGGEAVAADVQPGDISFSEAILTLKCQPADLGLRDTMTFFNDSPRFAYERPAAPCDLRSGIICCPNNFQYADGAQLEEGSVRITSLADPGYWMDLPEHEYQAAKPRWCAKMVESALRFMPDVRPHAVDTDIFTPRTIRKFTGHLNGAVYGAAAKVSSGCTPVRNLFLCGTDQGFLGIIGSLLSGITMANAHLLREG
jgi:phytoene dehydrogenase-like protein